MSRVRRLTGKAALLRDTNLLSSVENKLRGAVTVKLAPLEGKRNPDVIDSAVPKPHCCFQKGSRAPDRVHGIVQVDIPYVGETWI
jgi:hypothetical protein